MGLEIGFDAVAREFFISSSPRRSFGTCTRNYQFGMFLSVSLLVRLIWFIWSKWFVLVRFGSTSGADLVSGHWFPMETSP